MPSVYTSGSPPGRAENDVREMLAVEQPAGVLANVVSVCRVLHPFQLCVGVDVAVPFPISL